MHESRKSAPESLQPSVVWEVRSSSADALGLPATLPHPHRLATLDDDTLTFVPAHPHAHPCACNAFLQWTCLLVHYLRAPHDPSAFVPVLPEDDLIAFEPHLDEATKAALRRLVSAALESEP